MANDKKQIHPQLITKLARLNDVAQGAFYFFGSGYPPLSLMSMDNSEIIIPRAHEVIEQIPHVVEKYPPAACLYIFEEIYRRHNLDLTRDQIATLRAAYLDILRSHSDKPHIRKLVASSKLVRDENRCFIPEYETLVAEDITIRLNLDDSYQNNPQAIEQLIRTNKPEVHRAIRKYGLIDTIKYRWWKRNALYAALEEAEKLAPAEFILHRYFDAKDSAQSGYYASKRLVKYKVEAEQLPVEFKVEFILKNPERVIDFFHDPRFIDELTNRRPDLFFKLINLKELVSTHAFKAELFATPFNFSGKLVEAAANVGTFEEVKYLENQLEGLGWTKERYPRLRDKVEEAREKANENAKKDAKGKEESDGVAIIRINTGYTTAKIELDNVSQLDKMIVTYKNAKKLEIFTPSAILVVDVSKKAGVPTEISVFSVDPTHTVYFPEQFSIGACKISTRYISSEHFQAAYFAKVSPSEIIIKPLGFFGRIAQWLRGTRKPVVPPKIKKEEYVKPGVSSSVVKMRAAFSASEREDTDTQSSSSEDQPKEFKASDSSVVLYKSARKSFLDGKYEEALRTIHELMSSLQGKYRHSDDGSTKNQDEVGLITKLLREILREAKADITDCLMVDELLQQKVSETSLNELTHVRAALVHLVSECDYKTINYQILPLQWQGPFQLFLLERQFLDLSAQKNTITYKREVEKLQKNYMAILENNRENLLAKAMAASSQLLNYQVSYEVAKARLAVMGMFERDSHLLIKQMFSVLAQNQLSEPSQFVSSVILKLGEKGLGEIMQYVRDFYPSGLEMLIQASKYFAGLLFENELRLMNMVRNVCPEMRQALRKFLPDKFSAAKKALKESLDLDVQNILNGESLAEQKFADPSFVDEIEAHLDVKKQILDNDDIYNIYKKHEHNYSHGIQQLFNIYAKNENPPEDLLPALINQAGMVQVLKCVSTLCPHGLKILLDRQLLPEKEYYVEALARSDFVEVRQTLRQSGFELSEKVKGILARKARKAVEAIVEREIAQEKLNDKFFVDELFMPENKDYLIKFENKFPGLLKECIPGHLCHLVQASAAEAINTQLRPLTF